MKRQSVLNRRNFILKSTLTAMNIALGANIVFAKNLRNNMIPIGLEDHPDFSTIPGKHPEMVILNDRPLNAETPAHLLDQRITGNDVFFIRNNGLPPSESTINPASWTIEFDGESVKQKKSYTLKELKTKFKSYTYQLTLECGGNGRKEFNPPAKGNQWSTGAVGCAEWTGVRLKDVLKDVGIKSDAVYIGYYGKDMHLSGDPGKNSISRGVPMQKAMEDESLIAWAMNGEDIPIHNGYPLRLVFGGWPASCSGKWLHKISVRNKIHDGTKMTGDAYRVPCNPVAPGSKVQEKDMCIIESMPVKSLITFPKSGAQIKLDQELPIRGHAWAGDYDVKEMHYSIDFGSTWERCNLESPVNRLAWQYFSAKIKFPETGYYEVWAKATDRNGRAQPMLIPGWNPKGYLNNACHRIAIKVV
jgi:sulfite oxidase